MRNERSNAIWAGLGLIGLGVAFLVALFVGWDKAWPIFPLFGGLAFLLGYVASGFRDDGLVFVGTAALLIGLFFFGFTLGVWDWEDMSWLWPAFPLIGGVAFIAAFLAGRARDWGTMGIGLAAIIAGIVGFAFTVGGLGSDIWKFWPVLIILGGLFGLFGGLFRRGRKP